VKPEIREVVETAARLIAAGREELRQADLKLAVNLDKSALSRRVAGAIDGGYLKNLEERKRRPARLVLGDPLPADRDLLPKADLLIRKERLHGCTVDPGDKPPPPPWPQSGRAISINSQRKLTAQPLSDGRGGYERGLRSQGGASRWCRTRT
jgi:hypothetical protein